MADVCAKSNEATDDVDDAKHSGRLVVVCLFDVDLLLGGLDDVDHLVGGSRCLCYTLLLHFELSLFAGSLCEIWCCTNLSVLSKQCV